MNNQLGLRGTYSPSLRDRSVWKVIGPVLEASSGVTEVEGQVPQTSDLTFQQETTTKTVQILLLTPTSLDAPEKQSTGLRLRQFVASSPAMHPSKAIAFLLSEDSFTSASGRYSLNSLLALQVVMFESLTNLLPVISIPDAPSFLPAIQDFMANLEDIPVPNPSLTDSVALLSHATSDYPGTLSEETRNILSDLFPSFRKMSQATRSQEGQKIIEHYFDSTAAENIINFWKEDVSRE
ncbi:uncharacterized protein DSM5745_05195 [Aspergillus mulundensis]|uniref:Uncharacterized protein n=1 Tax=Aspergillus mulundensis TaxID=1810919 RepID=A0A3D8S5T6_9EURO|nr:hypothetical protein DSM5745_05195 [Aspergillus mulundensis]RDW81638.1 hypothetical protein DSM5745_05195 [Aspergillus mulundensis]